MSKGRTGLLKGLIHRASYITFFTFISLLVPTFAFGSGCDGAGNCYVRSGAGGTGTGVDWTNAYTDLPATLTRGVTYWVAAGTYAPHVFNDPVSGTALITVQAPTAANHGTSTGWQASYVGQALWQCTKACGPVWDLSMENYIVFNGSYATPQAPYTNVATSGYGFKIATNGYGGNGNTGNDCVLCGDIQGGEGELGSSAQTYDHDVTIEYVEIAGNNQSADNGLADAAFSFMGGSYNLYFGHLYVHGASWDFFLKGNHQGTISSYGSGNNITVEDSYLTRDYTDQGSGTGPHGAACSCSEGLTNFTWRYNVVTDMVGTSYGPDTASGGDYNTGNGNGGPWYIYGNVWYADNSSWCAAGDGLIAVYDFSMTNGGFYFYNNTVANLGTSFCPAALQAGLSFGLTYTTPMDGVYEQNNLWYLADLSQYNGSNVWNAGTTSQNGATFSPAIVHGYDAYYQSPETAANDNDSNKQVSSTNPFVSVSGGNFTLTSDTNPGTSLTNVGTYWNGSAAVSNTFNVDMNGVTRGADGVWDRGAQQLGSASSATLQSIAVTPASPSIASGSTQQFTATGTYSNGTTQTLTTSATWSSSNTAVATIASGGEATGVGSGSATITATDGSVNGSTTLAVTAAASPTMKSITVTPASASIASGATQQYTATATYSNGTTGNVTTSSKWSSSNTAVVTISSSGMASAVGSGSTTLTATDGSASGSTTVTVTTPTMQSITVTPAAASLASGSTQQYTATATYSNGTTGNITSSAKWASSNTGVATISASGLASGVAAGTTTIAATSGSVSGSTSLTVTSTGTTPTAPKLTSITVTPTTATIKVGQSVQFTATGTYSNGTTSNLTTSVTWSSSNTSVATIGTQGVAHGLKTGNARIKATYKGKSDATKLTVNKSNSPPTQ